MLNRYLVQDLMEKTHETLCICHVPSFSNPKMHNKYRRVVFSLTLALIVISTAGCFRFPEWGKKVQAESQSSEELVEQAKAHYKAGRYEEAGRFLQKAIDVDKRNVEAYKWLALTCREIITRGYDAKIYGNTNYFRKLAYVGYRSLDRAVRLAPEDMELRLMRGIAGVAMPFFIGKLDQGIDDLKRVLKSGAPDSAKTKAMYWLGKAYRKKGMHYWIKLVSKDPNSKTSKAIFEDIRPASERFDPSRYDRPLVAIDFLLGFQDELEPQTAVWIEDRSGNFVKTIYVSGFSGHAKETQVRLPKWAESSEFLDVDAVTGASIDLGQNIFVWDLKDYSGRKVPPGEYKVKVEVAYWPSKLYQLVETPIRLGDKGDRSVATEGHFIPYLEVVYFPE